LLVSEAPCRTPFAAIDDCSPCEDEPAHDGDAGQDRRDRVTKKYGGGDGTSKGGEIRRDVVDRGNESLVDDMCDSDEDTTREGHGQEQAHHGCILSETFEASAADDDGDSANFRIFRDCGHTAAYGSRVRAMRR
jgi:hypothetical protein